MRNQFQANLVVYGDTIGLGIWALSHYLQHLNYNDILAGLNPPTVLPVYPIQECPLFGRDDRASRFWLDSHEHWHEQLRQTINFTGANLADFDWHRKEYFYEWLDYHNAEHDIINVALGAQ